jgi:Pyruvate/2-oxoglutarate dehydrogenase complex, dehydrogenase (E1) component, eukaryotic type, beta subunit
MVAARPLQRQGLLKSAIRDNNPVIFFEHVLLYNLKQDVPDSEYLLPLDKAELVQTGQDVTILTYSRMRHHVLQALLELRQWGIQPEIIDLISLRPLDWETISASVRKTHRVVVVEECMKTGGIGAEISAGIMERLFDELDAPVVRLSSVDVPTPYNGTLERLTVVQPEQIVSTVVDLVKGKI